MRKIYQALAIAIGAYQNCVKSNNQEWADKWLFEIDSIQERLPHGGGFDNGSVILISSSNPDKIVISTAFHHMDNGYYTAWTTHNIIITPSLQFGFNLKVTGKNRNMIKDYIVDCFHSILNEVLETEWESVKTSNVA